METQTKQDDKGVTNQLVPKQNTKQANTWIIIRTHPEEGVNGVEAYSTQGEAEKKAEELRKCSPDCDVEVFGRKVVHGER